MISIIVPIYKAEQYIHRCVDSILAQSYTDFELLLINDGSPDGCGAICDAYAVKDSRVRVFHKENGGVSSARNFGIESAIGEWIIFIDSDDYLQPCFLSKLTTLLDADWIIGGYKETLGPVCSPVAHLFEGKEIRSIWDSEKEEYFFSVIDIISALTESNNPRNYWNTLKRRMTEEEKSELYAKCVQL